MSDSQVVHEFAGTTYLLTEPDTILDANVKVDLTRITVIADGAEIGAWHHDAVKVNKVDDVVHLTAGGETLVLDVDGRDLLLDLLGFSDPDLRSSRKRRTRTSEYAPEGRNRFSLADMKTQIIEEGANRIDRRLAILMGGAAAAIILGAALGWGPFRILEPGSFPIGRLLAAFGGLGGFLALYLAYFDRSRVTGSAAAVAAGVVTFTIMYFYARAARLGIGFMLALLGAQGLIAVGVAGMLRRPTDDEDR